MEIAIASIQRNRNPYIVEWLAFHLCVGFNKFYIYAHQCDDGMKETLAKLAPYYPIVWQEIDCDFAQKHAYAHAIDNYLIPQSDWMAFIDGDEFLFPVQHNNMAEALANYTDKPLSALGVYWMCYGSSGHLTEPSGLLLENFTRHAEVDCIPNRYVKSIVRGGGRHVNRISEVHVFETTMGTFDEQMRPIVDSDDASREPSHKVFRINHYLTQSYDSFRYIKSQWATPDSNVVGSRGQDWFDRHDRNEFDDGVRYRFLIALKLKINEMSRYLE